LASRVTGLGGIRYSNTCSAKKWITAIGTNTVAMIKIITNVVESSHLIWSAHSLQVSLRNDASICDAAPSSGYATYDGFSRLNI
jgi:hypothetical protein